MFKRNKSKNTQQDDSISSKKEIEKKIQQGVKEEIKKAKKSKAGETWIYIGLILAIAWPFTYPGFLLGSFIFLAIGILIALVNLNFSGAITGIVIAAIIAGVFFFLIETIAQNNDSRSHPLEYSFSDS